MRNRFRSNAVVSVVALATAGSLVACASKTPDYSATASRVEAAASRTEAAANQAEASARSAADASARAEAAASKAEAMFGRGMHKR